MLILKSMVLKGVGGCRGAMMGRRWSWMVMVLGGGLFIGDAYSLRNAIAGSFHLIYSSS